MTLQIKTLNEMCVRDIKIEPRFENCDIEKTIYNVADFINSYGANDVSTSTIDYWFSEEINRKRFVGHLSSITCKEDDSYYYMSTLLSDLYQCVLACHPDLEVNNGISQDEEYRQATNHLFGEKYD